MRMILLALLVAMPAAARDKSPPLPPPPASIDGLPIGAIPQQQLPAKGCVAFLWSRTPSHALVAMAVADPATIRLTVDGKVQDFARTAGRGDGGYGFALTSEYQGGDVTATLELGFAAGAEMPGGARIADSTLRIDRPGRDTVIVPVGGLIGCA